MNITREAILNRKAELEKQLEDLLNNANAANGAILDCQYWLTVLDDEDKAEGKEDLAGG